jgi:hypothetical protein
MLQPSGIWITTTTTICNTATVRYRSIENFREISGTPFRTRSHRANAPLGSISNTALPKVFSTGLIPILGVGFGIIPIILGALKSTFKLLEW